MSRLNPENDYLFQRPKKAVNDSDEVWYDNVVVGKRTLGDKMRGCPSQQSFLSCILRSHYLTSVDTKHGTSWHCLITGAKAVSAAMLSKQV